MVTAGIQSVIAQAMAVGRGQHDLALLQHQQEAAVAVGQLGQNVLCQLAFTGCHYHGAFCRVSAGKDQRVLLAIASPVIQHKAQAGLTHVYIIGLTFYHIVIDLRRAGNGEAAGTGQNTHAAARFGSIAAGDLATGHFHNALVNAHRAAILCVAANDLAAVHNNVAVTQHIHSRTAFYHFRADQLTAVHGKCIVIGAQDHRATNCSSIIEGGCIQRTTEQLKCAVVYADKGSAATLAAQELAVITAIGDIQRATIVGKQISSSVQSNGMTAQTKRQSLAVGIITAIQRKVAGKGNACILQQLVFCIEQGLERFGSGHLHEAHLLAAVVAQAFRLIRTDTMAMVGIKLQNTNATAQLQLLLLVHINQISHIGLGQLTLCSYRHHRAYANATAFQHQLFAAVAVPVIQHQIILRSGGAAQIHICAGIVKDSSATGKDRSLFTGVGADMHTGTVFGSRAAVDLAAAHGEAAVADCHIAADGCSTAGDLAAVHNHLTLIHIHRAASVALATDQLAAVHVEGIHQIAKVEHSAHIGGRRQIPLDRTTVNGAAVNVQRAHIGSHHIAGAGGIRLDGARSHTIGDIQHTGGAVGCQSAAICQGNGMTMQTQIHSFSVSKIGRIQRHILCEAKAQIAQRIVGAVLLCPALAKQLGIHADKARIGAAVALVAICAQAVGMVTFAHDHLLSEDDLTLAVDRKLQESTGVGKQFQVCLGQCAAFHGDHEHRAGLTLKTIDHQRAILSVALPAIQSNMTLGDARAARQIQAVSIDQGFTLQRHPLRVGAHIDTTAVTGSHAAGDGATADNQGAAVEVDITAITACGGAVSIHKTLGFTARNGAAADVNVKVSGNNRNITAAVTCFFAHTVAAGNHAALQIEGAFFVTADVTAIGFGSAIDDPTVRNGHHGGSGNIQVAAVIQCSTAGNRTAVHIHLAAAANMEVAAGACPTIGDQAAAQDHSAMDGHIAAGAGFIGFTILDGAAGHGQKYLTTGIDITAVTGFGFGVAAASGNNTAGNDDLRRAVSKDIAAHVAGIAIEDLTILQLKHSAAANEDISAVAALYLQCSLLILMSGLSSAAGDRTAVHTHRAAKIYRATGAVGPTAVGRSAGLRLRNTANDRAIVQVEIPLGVDHDHRAVGADHITAVQSTAIHIGVTVANPQNAALTGVTMTNQRSLLFRAGIHHYKLRSGALQRNHAAILGSVDLVAVEVNAHLHIGLQIGCAGQLQVGHHLIVTGARGEVIHLRPLIPGNSFLTVEALCLVGQEIIGALCNKHMGQLSCQVLNTDHPVINHRLRRNTLGAGNTGHIPNAGFLRGFQHQHHAIKGIGGIELDHIAARTLHEEQIAGDLQRHLLQRQSINDQAILVKDKTHKIHGVQLVDHLALCRAQRDLFSIQLETDMEQAIRLRLTGRHTCLRFSVIKLTVQVHINLVGRNFFNHVRRCIGGFTGSISCALGQHQRQHRRQNHHGCNNADNQAFVILAFLHVVSSCLC